MTNLEMESWAAIREYAKDTGSDPWEVAESLRFKAPPRPGKTPEPKPKTGGLRLSQDAVVEAGIRKVLTMWGFEEITIAQDPMLREMVIHTPGMPILRITAYDMMRPDPYKAIRDKLDEWRQSMPLAERLDRARFLPTP